MLYDTYYDSVQKDTCWQSAGSSVLYTHWINDPRIGNLLFHSDWFSESKLQKIIPIDSQHTDFNCGTMWKASLLQPQMAAYGGAESVALVAYPSLDTSGWRYGLLTTSAQQQAAYESRDKLNIQNFYTIVIPQHC